MKPAWNRAKPKMTPIGMASHRFVVAVMGGHSVHRDEPQYEQVALLARALTRRNYLMVSGGGPGAMEATHLGSLLAYSEDSELESAISALSLSDTCFA